LYDTFWVFAAPTWLQGIFSSFVITIGTNLTRLPHNLNHSTATLVTGLRTNIPSAVRNESTINQTMLSAAASSHG
jgi:hypothetical protein